MRAWIVIGGFASLLVSWSARADIPPSPSRPDWDQEQAPLPEPPEKELPVVPVLMVALVGVSLVIGRRREAVVGRC